MDELSATGANPTIPPMTMPNRSKHWGTGGKSDHRSEYYGISKHQYAAIALKLARSATDDNIIGYKASDSEAYFYRRMMGEGGTQDD
jgi:hypothetical protein